jgi:hypothetical protein
MSVVNNLLPSFFTGNPKYYQSITKINSLLRAPIPSSLPKPAISFSKASRFMGLKEMRESGLRMTLK